MEYLSNKIFKRVINKIKMIENLDIDPDVEEFIINDSNNNVKNIITNMEKFKLYGKKITIEKE